MTEEEDSPKACVLAPALTLNVTIEPCGDQPEVHLHAGGQGLWIARLMAELGAAVTMVGPVGGEAGAPLGAVVDATDVHFERVPVKTANGVHVLDRRSGELRVVAEDPGTPLSRHESDELFGAALVTGLRSDICVLAGPGKVPVVDPEFYRRLTSDLRKHGVTVVADLSGPFTEAAAAGGVNILKASDEDLENDAHTRRGNSDPVEHAVACAGRLIEQGAETVVITLAEEGAVVVSADEVFTVKPPQFEPVEHRGAGDSLTAGLAIGTVRGLPLADAIRLGAAAGAMNVTRRGLGSGSRDSIERLAEGIEVVALEEGQRCAS